MYLYSLTLNQATAIKQTATGSFSAPGIPEVIVAKGKILELMRLDEDSFKLVSVYR